MQTLPTISLRKRLRITAYFALCVASLSLVHDLLVWGVGDYEFLLWNLLLAAIPAFMVYPVYRLAHRKHTTFNTAAIIIVVAAWLALLPNTFYLMTEFMHLNPGVLVNLPTGGAKASLHYGRGSGLYVFDSLLLLIMVIYGALSGSVALLDGYRLARRYFTENIAKILMAIVIVLVPIGIYIGRYGRWNSWDAIIQPGRVIADLGRQLSSADGLERFVILGLTIILFEALCLIVITHISLKK